MASGNIDTTQIIRWLLAIVFGSLITICADYVLSYFVLYTFTWGFTFPRIMAVALGSIFSGIIARKNGWLTGATTSVIYIIFLVCLFSCFSSYAIDERIYEYNWTSHLSKGMLFLLTGIIGGYLGGRLTSIKRK